MRSKYATLLPHAAWLCLVAMLIGAQLATAGGPVPSIGPGSRAPTTASTGGGGATAGTLLTLTAPYNKDGRHVLYVIDRIKRSVTAYQTERDGIHFLAAREFRYDLFSVDTQRTKLMRTTSPARFAQALTDALKPRVATKRAQDWKGMPSAQGADITAVIAPSDNNAQHVLYIFDVKKRVMAAYEPGAKGLTLLGAREFRYELFASDSHPRQGHTPKDVFDSLSDDAKQAAKRERELERTPRRAE